MSGRAFRNGLSLPFINTSIKQKQKKYEDKRTKEIVDLSRKTRC
jgi:hypothetical protein